MSLAYHPVSKLLHWLMAILLLGQLIFGWWMTSPYIPLHKSFGMIIGTLILLRILWRLAHTPASLPSSVPHWQVKIARGLHFLLYVGMIVMPLSGFVGAAMGPHSLVFFGWVLPKLPENLFWSDELFDIHSAAAVILACLMGLHVLAGLKHLFINKDGVFQRMWF